MQLEARKRPQRRKQMERINNTIGGCPARLRDHGSDVTGPPRRLEQRLADRQWVGSRGPRIAAGAIRGTEGQWGRGEAIRQRDDELKESGLFVAIGLA